MLGIWCEPKERVASLNINFRKHDGNWCKAINMGAAINSNGNDTCPFVTFDKKYLFFIRNDSRGALRIFWVDAKIIEELETEEIK